jgi:uncharacterized FlaG/YvyC family protein
MAEQNTTNIVNSGSLMATLINRTEQTNSVQVTPPKKTASKEVKDARPGNAEKSESGFVGETKAPPNPLGEVSLKFEIDSKTHDVTILLLDRVSQRVVRTIPPDEIAKLNPGELLQLFV